MSEQKKDRVGRGPQLFAERWDFYRRSAHMWMVLALGLGGTLLLAVIIIFFLAVRGNPQPDFFLTDGSGRPVTRIASLSDPDMGPVQVKAYLADALPQLFSLNYFEIDKQMDGTAPFFIEKKYHDDFVRALQASSLYTQIKDGHLVMSSVVSSSPQLVEEGLGLSSRHHWVMDIETVRTLSSGTEQKSDYVTYRVDLYRMPRDTNPNGLAILNVNQISTKKGY